MKMKEGYNNGGRFTDSPLNGNPKKRSRQIFTPQQIQILETSFHKNNFPDRDTIDNLVQALDINDVRIMNWFKNRRSRNRREAKDGCSPTVDVDEADNGLEDMSPPSSPIPKRKPFTSLKKTSTHTGGFSIQKLMEKDTSDVAEPAIQPPPRMMTQLPHRQIPMFMNSPQPIRQLHHMTSFLPHTPDRSLTSSLSQILMSQIDHQMTPDMHMRSLRHLESLQSRPFENGQGFHNYYLPKDVESGNPLWDLYFTYNTELVPIRKYYDAVVGVTQNVISGECGRVLRVL